MASFMPEIPPPRSLSSAFPSTLAPTAASVPSLDNPLVTSTATTPTNHNTHLFDDHLFYHYYYYDDDDDDDGGDNKYYDHGDINDDDPYALCDITYVYTTRCIT